MRLARNSSIWEGKGSGKCSKEELLQFILDIFVLLSTEIKSCITVIKMNKQTLMFLGFLSSNIFPFLT